ncbi:hypothetical protein M3Y98_00185000 [Aphelenchoides besseyi]|nr:hypothetical protein M3Y98_00185000 [Aphelenchoides besseyi]KAI6200155.1 hypothetical protein M3Y96_00703000 [Aphelenchoides besseyi]
MHFATRLKSSLSFQSEMSENQKVVPIHHFCFGNLDVHRVTAISSFLMFISWSYVLCRDTIYSIQLSQQPDIQVIRPSNFTFCIAIVLNVSVIITPFLLFVGNRRRIPLLYLPAIYVARPLILFAVFYMIYLIVEGVSELAYSPEEVVHVVQEVVTCNVFILAFLAILYFLNVAAQDHEILRQEQLSHRFSSRSVA